MEPKIYFATDHDIDHHLIDSDALFVIEKLRDAGFTAYLVGGSIRDLLAKKQPKDFDISTSALPDQVKHIFRRNCLIIGRRFRLAHIRFGKKIIEVSTFRSGDTTDDDLIVHDNEWGTPEQDALRRDFTINGLFYDPLHRSIIDYVGGWEDIHKKTLRTIGNPKFRFKQDPVRMIRLLKFQARFGFSIDPDTLTALHDCKEEIVKSSPARILEEILRMLESGASAPFFHLMTESDLLEILFPCLTHILQGKHGNQVYQYLKHADQIHLKEGQAFLPRPVLMSCLLFSILESEIQIQFLNKNIMPNLGEIALLTASMIKGVVTSSFSHFPRRLSAAIGFILITQYRLTPLYGHRSYRHKLLHNKEFYLALHFLRLRALVDETLSESYEAWLKAYRHIEHHGERRPHPRHPHVEDRKQHGQHQ